jgi:hypothetical protein
MRRNWSRSKKRHFRELRLQRKREAHRLARLDASYDANKPIGLTHSLDLNKNFRPAEPARGKKIFSLPRSLNFDSDEQETVHVLTTLKSELLYGDASEVFMDQKSLEEISPEAAVVLYAELRRCLAYASRRKRIRGNYPASANAAKMLAEIGFYRALNVPEPSREKQQASRIYFKLISFNRTDGRIANSLISTFQNVISFDSIAKKRLYAALTECMDNVRAHAYTKDDPLKPDLFGEWWMAGFCDLASREVAFVFFDQGVGIPSTLKSKLEHRLMSFLKWGDTDLIKIAVEEGISKERGERHGSGLPSLKEFINELSPGGFLRVIANRGDYTYYKKRAPTMSSPTASLDGSLIVWSIQPEPETVTPMLGDLRQIDLTVR